MKRLYIVRHAKSSWDDLLMNDFDRPLNKRGRSDAPRMAEFMVKKSLIPDVLISSAAKRAMETATYFAQAFGMPLSSDRSLYHAPEQKYFETAYSLSENIQSAMFFGHNPGITFLANSVSEDYIDNVPTCGVLVIDSTAESWDTIDPTNSTLKSFYYPKMLS